MVQWLALSTQSVGTGQGGTVAMLARVSLVDFRGTKIFDEYIVPTVAVTNYRTSQTGIEAKHLSSSRWTIDNARTFVASAISGRILVGYCLWQDLHVLGLTHPAIATRDVGLFLPYRDALKSRDTIVGLPTLTYRLMGRAIAQRHTDSMENCRAALDLYRSYQAQWEKVIDEDKWPCALPPSSYSRCYS